ncbi:MAG: putative DNA binding domain-containing protein [Clostridia bacterium]|nr:putative DNA binding domain-containing protein [Clostridia bacterium]
MQFRKSDTVALKREYTDEVRDDIIAMANRAGGKIFIGVGEDGAVEGVSDAACVIGKIAAAARGSVTPDIIPLVRCGVLTATGKNIVAVSVREGTEKPYRVAEKTALSESAPEAPAVFSAPAVNTADGANYEDARAYRQDLTFAEAEKAFAALDTVLDAALMRALGLTGPDGLYTNLGLLLSDQCPFVIKAATFAGSDQQEFQDRREFGGSLLKQINDAYDYLEQRDHNHASFDGLRRMDRKDYPVPALRESLLNAVVHRDYAIPAGTLISVFADRVEFVSAGGLAHGMTLDDVLLGLSICRNRKLANVFTRLKLIETYGTGMRKIQTVYENDARQPSFTASANAFRVVLPKRTPNGAAPVTARPADERGVKIVEYIREHGSAARHDIEELLDVKTATAVRIIRDQLDAGVIIAAGKGKNTRYNCP